MTVGYSYAEHVGFGRAGRNPRASRRRTNPPGSPQAERHVIDPRRGRLAQREWFDSNDWPRKALNGYLAPVHFAGRPGSGAKEVVQLQPLARRVQLDDLEDDVGQENLRPHGQGTAARRENFGLEGI